MEAIVPQLVSAQPQAHTVNQGQLGKGSGAGFQTALVKHIGSTTADSAGVNSPSDSAASAIVHFIAASEVEASSDGQLVLEDILSLIDGLIDQLEETTEDETKTSDEQITSFHAMLDQLNALLTLLGAPVMELQQLQSAPDSEASEMVKQAEFAMSNVKSGLQDALLQLQQMLHQGTLKHVQQQEPLVIIGQQIKALADLLNGEAERTGKSAADKSSVGEFVAVPQKGPVQTEASTLLQRLSQQTVHPAFASAMLSAKGGEQSLQSEAVPVQADPNMISQLTANQTDVTRGFAPTLAKAAPTAYVLADEFAQTMTGLIVQKFDVRTLNGLSEAKLMLFPEHLGQVDVRITMQNGLMTAIFQTDTAMAKDMLENQMAQLRLALQSQGLTIDKLEVSQGQSAAQLFQQQQGQSSGQQQFSNRQPFRNEESMDDQAFESELVEQAAIQGLGYGRAINASV